VLQFAREVLRGHAAGAEVAVDGVAVGERRREVIRDRHEQSRGASGKCRARHALTPASAQVWRTYTGGSTRRSRFRARRANLCGSPRSHRSDRRLQEPALGGLCFGSHREPDFCAGLAEERDQRVDAEALDLAAQKVTDARL